MLAELNVTNRKRPWNLIHGLMNGFTIIRLCRRLGQ